MAPSDRSMRALPWGVLVLGLLAAWALATFGPAVPPIAWPLPAGLAARWSEDASLTAQEVVFRHPEALWLMPLAVLPFLVVVVRRSLVDAPAFQIVAQVVLRVLVLLGLALALAQPTLQAPVRGKSVVLVVDVSDSLDEAQLTAARKLVDEARAQVADEADLPYEDRTRLALVTYAGRTRVRELAEDTPTSDLVTRHPDDPWASDHGGALRLAAALVDAERERRVVLVTDGGGTLAEREDLARAVAELERQDIAVHVRSTPPTTRDDVLVRAIHLPANMRIGETFDLAIDLLATRPTTVRLQVTKNGQPNALLPEQTVELRGGLQQVAVPTRVTEAGTVVFEARLDPASIDPAVNRRTENDRAAALGEVRGRPRILLVGTGGDEHLAEALRADHLDVVVASGAEVPTSEAEIRAFDLVVFSDVPARAVRPEARETVRRYVVDHGGGFLMIGGEHAYGLGGWDETTLASILPVRFEGERQREQPMLALVLVIDKSGSMSSDDKLDLVKEAARATARTLEPSDELGVVAFDSRPITLVRLQPAGNRIRIASDIRRLTAGGGTNALPALREAYLQLAGSDARVKHVILLSDGQSPENGIAALLGDMRDADITVSAIGVGAGAGKDLLRRIASRGRGRFYYSHDGTDVPRIFSRETQEVTRNAAKEQLFQPRVAKNVQALRGIDFGGAPGLRGIVPIQPKPLSEVLLRTQTGEALLVRARRGLGRSAAFASDAKARWAAPWLGWGGFAKLWSQVARDTMRQGASDLGGATLVVDAAIEGGVRRAVVDVDAPEGFANDLVGHVEIEAPAGEAVVEPIPLRLAAPGRYEARLPDAAPGEPRLVRARLFDQSQSPPRLAAEATAAIAVPYPDELLPPELQGGTSSLRRWPEGEREGPLGEVLTAPGDGRGRTRDRALWPFVLAVVVLPLLALDLLLRRVSLGTRRLRA